MPWPPSPVMWLPVDSLVCLGCGCFLSYCLCFYFSPLYFVSCSCGQMLSHFTDAEGKAQVCSSSRTLGSKSQKPLKLALVGQQSGLQKSWPQSSAHPCRDRNWPVGDQACSFSRQSPGPLVSFSLWAFSLQSAQNDHHPHLTPVL